MPKKKPEVLHILRTVRLPTALDHRIKIIGFWNDMSKNDVMVMLIKAGLDSLEAKGDPRFQSKPKDDIMKINSVNNLFPLNLVFPSAHGYYVNAAGEILSTRRYANPTKLNGWVDNRGHVVTLAGTTYLVNDVLNRASKHPEFTNHTGASGLQLSKPQGVSQIAGRTHAPALKAGIEEKGIIIGTLKDDKLSFSEKPAVHLTDASWKSEIERLATAQPGTQFIAVKVVASVTSGGLQWK